MLVIVLVFALALGDCDRDRFVRDFMRYKDRIQCGGHELVAAVRADALREAPQFGGEYYALHVRRGDFQYKASPPHPSVCQTSGLFMLSPSHLPLSVLALTHSHMQACRHAGMHRHSHSLTLTMLSYPQACNPFMTPMPPYSHNRTSKYLPRRS